MCFSEKVRGKVWKDYIERIINEENDWDSSVEGDAVEDPVVCVTREEVLQATYEMKAGKNPGPSEVSLELIAARGGVGIQAIAEISETVLDGIGMLVECALSIVAPDFKGKGDIRNCSCHRAVKHSEHEMKVLKRSWRKRLCRKCRLMKYNLALFLHQEQLMLYIA